MGGVCSGYDGGGGFDDDSDDEHKTYQGDEGADDSSSRPQSLSPAAGGGPISLWGPQPGASAQGLGQDTVAWLMEAAAGGGAVTRGSGWAGSTHWRYRGASDPSVETAKPARITARHVLERLLHACIIG